MGFSRVGRFGRVGLAGIAIALAGVGARPAAAHHGKDFLVVESCELPHPGQAFLIADVSHFRESDGSASEFSPAILVSAGSRFAFEMHVHLAKDGAGSWTYDATAPAIHVALTPPSAESAWKTGLSAEYEIAAHATDSDRFEGRVVIMRQGARSDLTFNLVGARQNVEGRDTTFGYAVGFRPDRERRVGWGVEAEGTFGRAEAHEVIAGVYSELSERWTLKFGVGAGLGPGSPSLTARFGIVCRI